MKHISFAQKSKKFLIGQLLSETATPADLCSRYHISSGQFYTWKRHYAKRKLAPESSRNTELASRVQKLERLIGRLALEKEFLKKPYRTTAHKPRKEGVHRRESYTHPRRSKRGKLMDLPQKSYH